MRVAESMIAICVSVVIGACGGGGGNDGNTNPPPPAAVASVSLSKTTALLQPTETTLITASPKDANGNVLSGRTVNWSVGSTNVATIAPNGSSVTVTAVANGQTQVTATVEGIPGTATITVTNSFPTSGSVTVGAGGQDAFDPTQVDIASGGTVTFSWAAGPHNVTWTSPPSPVGDITDRSSGSVPVTFNSAGTYNFHCTLHAGMNGVVVVH